MDDIGHILWSIALYYHHDWLLAALFGVLPDILVFVPFYAAKLAKGKVRSANDLKPKYDIGFYNKWVPRGYAITHSLLFFALILLSCSFIFGYRVEYWAMLVHILVDAPSHRRSWFGTQLFWPFSKYQFNGVSWATREYMLANYTALALVFGLRLFGL